MRKTLTLNNPVVMQLQNSIFGTPFNYLESAHEHFRQILTEKQQKNKYSYDDESIKGIITNIHDEFIDFIFEYANLKDQDLKKIGRFFDIEEPLSEIAADAESEAYNLYYRKSLSAVVLAQITRKGKESALCKLEDEFSDILYFHIYDLELNNKNFMKRIREVYSNFINHDIQNQNELSNVLFHLMIQLMIE